jgi:mRNA interferase RelE/StbE
LAWTIEFERKADKQLDKINPRDAARIVKLLEEIAALDDPRTRGRALTGDLGGLWRYRYGDWRIIARIENQKLVILVIAIGHRREVYR